MKTFFHPDQRLHHPHSYFSRGRMREPQELPDRIAPLLAAVQQLGFAVHEPPDQGLKPLRAVHGDAYLQFLQTAHARWKQMPADWGDEVMSNVFVREPNAARGILAEAARYLADGSCPVGPHTWTSSYAAAQAALAGADALLNGERMAYALCRPPGHHARREAAGGFCYLNSAAAAAQRLRATHARVTVLDTDMHHGQGVQDIFWQRADVQYVSIHGDPTNFYPVVAGHADEQGEAAGWGFNLNLPMPHGSSEAVFFAQLDRALQAVQAFDPGAVVLSLGFDIYREDPQSMLDFSAEGFARLGAAIAGLKRPVLVVQEGGYHLGTLQSNAQRFFGGLLGR